jgi:hypothetical protein
MIPKTNAVVSFQLAVAPFSPALVTLSCHNRVVTVRRIDYAAKSENFLATIRMVTQQYFGSANN